MWARVSQVDNDDKMTVWLFSNFRSQTYEELISLAEDGDDEYINFLGKDLKTTSGDAYSTIADEFFLFSFGKATNGDLGKYSKDYTNNCTFAIIMMYFHCF